MKLDVCKNKTQLCPSFYNSVCPPDLERLYEEVNRDNIRLRDELHRANDKIRSYMIEAGDLER